MAQVVPRSVIATEPWFRSARPRELQELAAGLERSDPTFESPEVRRMADLVERSRRGPEMSYRFYARLVDHVLDGFPFDHFEDMGRWARYIGPLGAKGLAEPNYLIRRMSATAGQILSFAEALPSTAEPLMWDYINQLREARAEWFAAYDAEFRRLMEDSKVGRNKRSVQKFERRFPDAEARLRKIRGDMDAYRPPNGRRLPDNWESVRDRIGELLSQLMVMGHLNEYVGALASVYDYYRNTVEPLLRVRDRLHAV